MSQIAATPKTIPEQAYFLSEILGARVLMADKKIGKLSDMVIKENGTLPVVTNLCVSMPFGEHVVVAWEWVDRITSKEICLKVNDIKSFPNEPDENAVLLRDHILDKKAVDLEGREMEVVYDIKLILRNQILYVSDVDLSRYGLLRRMGLTWLANIIYNLAESIREQTISWTYIQPLPDELGRFRGDLQFKILKEKLEDMHPVDLADILEEMDHDQRVKLFDELDPEQASDTLEEINPNVQRDLVSSLKVEKVAQLIDEMTTGQAADVLSILSGAEADDILELLSPENAKKIQAIMEQQEENILNYATSEYIKFFPDQTVEQVLDDYRRAAKDKDVVMYLYIVEENDKLLGVLDIKELLQAEESALIRDVMVENVISLDPDSTLKEASEIFDRYDFRALPITDDNDKILGVITYRDVMNLRHRFIEPV
jgi:magnesium transporter